MNGVMWLKCLAILVLTAFCFTGCDKPADDAGAATGSSSAGGASAARVDPSALEVLFVYGSEKQDWVEAITPGFNNARHTTASGRTIVIKTKPMGSGESADDILNGRVQAHLWSPASGIFVKLANAESMVKGQPLVDATHNLVLSPIVIAMWKPMAEALGWPDRPIGWGDVIELSQDPKGWASRGRPEFGRFKFGHTHPEYSNSGISSVLIELFAATGKQRGLTMDDLKKPEVGKYLSDVERSVVHYGRSTGFFGKRLIENGPAYLSAAVVYENMVIEGNRKKIDPPLVAIYPKEGTIWSDHPVGIVQREWVTDEHREAAQQYIDYLRAPEQQQRALEFGFRPAEGGFGPPIDQAHGVDPAEPKTVLDLPGADVINGAIELWRQSKKDSTIALVFDRSGSMNTEGRINNARKGAVQLVEMLGPRDRLLLVPFSTKVELFDMGVMNAANRKRAIDTINFIQPGGRTALYEAIDKAREALASTDSNQRISAVVVLTDGEATPSTFTLDKLLQQLSVGVEDAGVRVFTISYGREATVDDMKRIADQSRGEFHKGETDNIIKVFRDIATFF